MSKTNPDSSETQKDMPDPQKNTLDQGDTQKDMPAQVDRQRDEIKQQWELIKESRQHESPIKKFLVVSIVVAIIAGFGWYVYNTHSEVTELRSEIKTLQVWMAVKMEKLQNKTVAKVDEVHSKVASVVKDSSNKETKLLKSIESKIKR